MLSLHSHTHCQVAQKSRPASQNLSKSMPVSTHLGTGRKKEVLATTMPIVHAVRISFQIN